MYQTQNQEIRIATSAHLAQTMTMLSMSAEEIREKIETELSVNPALELIEERICPNCRRKLGDRPVCPVCSVKKCEENGENIIFVSPRDDLYNLDTSGNQSADQTKEFDTAVVDDLPSYILKQIGAELDDKQKLIAVHLLTSLDEDGFITVSAAELGRYFHVPISEIHEVEEIIQHAEPCGVGSRNTIEALIIQLRNLPDTAIIPEKTHETVQQFFDLLAKSNYRELSKKLDIPIKEVMDIENFIRENLNPFPARAFWGSEYDTNTANFDVFHYPDIIISYQDGEERNTLLVEIVMPISGYLQVNQIFKQQYKNAPEEKSGFWKADIDRASLFVKCLNQRNHTMVRLMEKLTVLQSEYIRTGDNAMVPITRAQLSVDLDVHESTISRAVSNKTVMLPNKKVVPLSAFFDRSLNVRMMIKDLIRDEKNALSDQKIMEILHTQGIDIARRTVAKYRAMEGILPAHMRSNLSKRK